MEGMNTFENNNLSKLRMNETKDKNREDYVTFYKTIKKNQDDEKIASHQTEGKKGKRTIAENLDSIVHYYLALRSVESSPTKPKAKESPKESPKEAKSSDAIIYYYLALRGQ
jgi:hypothetical protein